jgi:integrase
MATKPIQFKEDFIPRITEGGVSRSDALSSASLLEVTQNRTDIPAMAVEKRAKFLNELGFGDITLGEIKEGGPKRDAFIKALVKHGSDTRTNELVGDFKKVLGEVGVAAARGANPFRAMMKETVGEADYLKAGFSTVIDRKIPLAYPPEVYTEVKKTVSGLLGSKDPVRRAAGVRMLLMMQGGYRPSDFKGLRIENINFETGIVKGLSLKTDSSSNVEGAGKKSLPIAYLPSSQRDVILHHINDTRKNSGLLFDSPEKLDKIINEELANADIPKIEYYSEGIDDYVKEKFSAYDFRRLMETHLSAQGYNETSTVRRALTWRPQEGNVQKYQAVLNESGRIEQANAASFQTWVLMSEGNAVVSPATETEPEVRMRTHGQFLREVGISNISGYTARYAVTASAMNNLPPFMQERAMNLSSGVVFSNDNIAPLAVDTDPDAAKRFQETAAVESETRQLRAETERNEAEIERRRSAQRLSETPEPAPAAAVSADPEKPELSTSTSEKLSANNISADDLKNMASGAWKVTKEVGKKIPLVGSIYSLPEAYRLGEKFVGERLDLPPGVSDVASVIGGGVAMAAELASPVAPTDVPDLKADIPTAYGQTFERMEQEREALLSRARKQAEEKGFLDPEKAARVREEAASAAAEPMGFLSP